MKKNRKQKIENNKLKQKSRNFEVKTDKKSFEKVIWKPGTMIYPLPAVMVSCGDINNEYNIITISWTGIICTDPAMP